ncbi:MAG TPA: M15 family metallopeptidase [Chitinophagaceae bacterium]|jgi:D-alanyl-D-alanine dipeptidase
MAAKITNRFNIRIIAISIFLVPLRIPSYSQKKLTVIKKISEYKNSLRQDSSKKMVELKTFAPGIQYNLRYATTNNFMHRQLYHEGDITFLRLPAAMAISKVQEELRTKGLLLKIWDAYRPYSVTVKMWEPIKDERYVADPKKGSGHNKGIAIDLTIVDSATGEELNMGTGFDNFSDTAHPDFKNLPIEVQQNRLLLKTVMEKYGFKQLETEWWHFYWNNTGFELLDIDPKKFKKIN